MCLLKCLRPCCLLALPTHHCPTQWCRNRKRLACSLRASQEGSISRRLPRTIVSLRNHDGNGNCNGMLLLFQNFRFKRFLVLSSNLLPLRVFVSGVLYCRSRLPGRPPLAVVSFGDQCARHVRMLCC